VCVCIIRYNTLIRFNPGVRYTFKLKLSLSLSLKVYLTIFNNEFCPKNMAQNLRGKMNTIWKISKSCVEMCVTVRFKMGINNCVLPRRFSGFVI